ncbi:MAG: hypothetical protein ACJ762_11945 [Solirubrobacteraceae bacterium]
MRRVLPLAAVLGLLAAAPAAHAGAVQLRITADTGPGTAKRHASLTCDSEGPRATGFLHRRDAAKLCTRAYALESFLGAAPRTGGACPMVYGGPDRAVVRGAVRGTAVHRRFSRADGCQLAWWNRARRLLPRAAGVTR